MRKKKKNKPKKKEIVLYGIPAAPGITMGPAYPLYDEEIEVPKKRVRERMVVDEIARFKKALVKTREEILAIHAKISKEMGMEKARIFGAHLMVLEDEVLIGEVIAKLKKEKFAVEYVFWEVLKKYIKVLSKSEDEYLRERVSDINDVAKRILKNLLGAEHRSLQDLKKKTVVVAYDLSPSDTALMHRGNVMAFVTDIGGRTSHTAIMAKSLKIPAVVGLESITSNVKEGSYIIVDGNRGIVVIDPSKETIKKYLQDKKRFAKFEKFLFKLKDLPAETLDGKEIELAANIELPDDVPGVLAHGAKGVGLYRTEYIYMNRKGLPTEEEQYVAYKEVAEKIKPNSVIVRTLDLGGDKFLSQLDVPHEMNPFLGWRAIRFCLAKPDIFKTQLRAILRASAFGKLKIMYPMISGIEELRQANDILKEVKDNLKKKSIPFDKDMEVGAMIEVPSAALTSDVLAKEADFFSIGTNDLIQYALAVDRVNEKIAYLYEPAHPAVLRLIKMIIDNAHREDVWVGMCGEMAGDATLTVILLGLGLDEFSTSPIVVPEVKRIVRSLRYEDAKKVAEKALTLSSSKEVIMYAKEKMEELVPKFVSQSLRLKDKK
ncbi:MAG: phosphoenolpyruvate--protein phosphotransferase [Candidatus Omnitrophica bacterium]|nr:phosphoenolpyruvate--protein phosphotransferase [Candidatus Omnitrophota bacterium]